MTAANVDMNRKRLNTADEKQLPRPDCYICHLAPDNEKAVATHNPGERLSWKLAAKKSRHTGDWGQKRLAMRTSCMKCHASTQIDYYYRRLDGAVNELNRMADVASESGMPPDNVKGLAIKGRIGAAMLGPLQLREAVEKLGSRPASLSVDPQK
jgi:hypothetical protein